MVDWRQMPNPAPRCPDRGAQGHQSALRLPCRECVGSGAGGLMGVCGLSVGVMVALFALGEGARIVQPDFAFANLVDFRITGLRLPGGFERPISCDRFGILSSLLIAPRLVPGRLLGR